MAIFPRPVSPKSAFGDFWSYFSEKRAHKWPLLGVSAAITWVIIWTFVLDSRTNTMPTRNKIIYFQSWDAHRPDAAIILQQKIDLAKSEEALRRTQKNMQTIADISGIEWRDEAERNNAKRSVAIKAINKQLDDRLIKAEAAEKADAAKPETPQPKAAHP